jgi:threonylcarbamoyladenosine tRNA methylthiotransferase MtaB
MKAAVITLGCKVNQAESASLVESLTAAGWEPSEVDDASLVVVNTCAVTGRAEREAVSIVRRLKRRRPGIMVAATGCLAQLSPEVLSGEDAADLVLGQAEKAGLTAHLGLPRGTVLVSGFGETMPDFPEARSERTRAFLKIQDGCQERCAYCAVPLARGPSRSHSKERALAGLKAHWEAGIREVVLTGVHLGLWGRDLTPADDLAGLLDEIERRLDPGLGRRRLRLSSIDPQEGRLAVKAMARRSGLTPQLHVPIQSGSDEILALMGRPYRRAEVDALLREMKDAIPDLNLGTDLMCGFPGETEENFLETRSLVEESALSHLHVFPFSPRPGTAAFDLPGKVHEAETRRRVGVLRDLDRVKRAEFLRSQLGRRREALVENSVHRASGRFRVLTDNYLTALLPEGFEAPGGELIEVELIASDNPWGLPEARP